ncbi:MAG: CCA tRNA nucleotidyltransferase [Planctomycetota bacterium]|jgi:tRNA nucleotidyltransferase/poly(A) polymerase
MTNRQAAIKIIKRLRHNGFEALLAGGCVRDMLLRRPATDYDIATDAVPDEVIKLFRRTLKVGAKFGVVIVLLEGKQVEVATFRTETGYADGRHPAKVKFATAAEDASRRDFTINGMFFDPLTKKVIDYVNGRADLKKRLIRTVGKPEERFSEDYLRMLRAVRFSTQLGFAIEPKTFTAIRKHANNIGRISGERIAMELEAILVSPDRSIGASLLTRSKLAETAFPRLNSKKMNLAVKVLSQLPKKVDFPLALAGLFAGCPTEFALEKCRLLKLSRNQTKHIKFLLANRGKLLEDKMSLAELKLTLAQPYFWDLYELQRAIQKAEDKSVAPLTRLRKRILGAVPGPGLGQLAQEMYIAQLEGNLQTAAQARQWVLKWLQKHRIIEK